MSVSVPVAAVNSAGDPRLVGEREHVLPVLVVRGDLHRRGLEIGVVRVGDGQRGRDATAGPSSVNAAAPAPAVTTGASLTPVMVIVTVATFDGAPAVSCSV